MFEQSALVALSHWYSYFVNGIRVRSSLPVLILLSVVASASTHAVAGGTLRLAGWSPGPTPVASRFNGTVNTVAASPNGVIYVCGRFTHIGAL
ncbi:MAG: hypothetical protein V3U76_13325 [Granulosicoccus sp.]